MTPGTLLEIVSGPWSGHLAELATIGADGLQVRLREICSPLGRREDPVTVSLADVRVVDLRARQA